MTKSILLTGDALRAGMIIKKLTEERTEALRLVNVEMEKAGQRIIADSNDAAKSQWDIIAKANGLDPDSSWGVYYMATEFYEEHGHMYVLPREPGSEILATSMPTPGPAGALN